MQPDLSVFLSTPSTFNHTASHEETLMIKAVELSLWLELWFNRSSTWKILTRSSHNYAGQTCLVTFDTSMECNKINIYYIDKGCIQRSALGNRYPLRTTVFFNLEYCFTLLKVMLWLSVKSGDSQDKEGSQAHNFISRRKFLGVVT